jgi:hypothetical protein
LGLRNCLDEKEEIGGRENKLKLRRKSSCEDQGNNKMKKLKRNTDKKQERVSDITLFHSKNLSSSAAH